MAASFKLSIDLVLKPIEIIGPEVHKALTTLCRLTDPSKNRPFAEQNLPCADELPRETFPSHEFWESHNFERIGNTGMHFNLEDEEEHTTYTHPNLNIRCDVNHGYRAIRGFLDWILPYVESVPKPGRYDDEFQDNDLVTVSLAMNGDGNKGWVFKYYDYEDWYGEGALKLVREAFMSDSWKEK